MDYELILNLIKTSGRVKIQYRDSFGFIVWGIVINKPVSINDSILVDNKENKIPFSSVIKVKAI